MHYDLLNTDTICAISTPPGNGGVALIRVSGAKALLALRSCCRKLPRHLDSHRLYLAEMIDTDNREPLDQVLVSYFAEGKSFTGEETIEVSCHGGELLAQAILREFMKNGCRPAQPGEFTLRSFLNGKMDLVQAESVHELIKGQSRAALRVAMRHLSGELSKTYEEIEKGLLWLLAQIEGSIDFSEENLDVVARDVLARRCSSINAEVKRLIESYASGRRLQEGFRVALLGDPNVGKSSLLNALLRTDRAIVTEVPGTTRDLVEGSLYVGGQKISVVDTAGLRETKDQVEMLGIERSRQAARLADQILYVIDAESIGDDLSGKLDWILELGIPVAVLINKSDLLEPAKRHGLGARVSSFLRPGVSLPVLCVSAVTGDGRGLIEQLIENASKTRDAGGEALVTQARHLHLLEKIAVGLEKAESLLHTDESLEFIAFELQESIYAVHEILGKEFHEQVIDQIFKEFCLGK